MVFNLTLADAKLFNAFFPSFAPVYLDRPLEQPCFFLAHQNSGVAIYTVLFLFSIQARSVRVHGMYYMLCTVTIVSASILLNNYDYTMFNQTVK